MRHAKSAWDTNDVDFDRPLAERGLRDRERMARWLASSDLVPDRILTSGALRTRDTALHVAEVCGLGEWSVRVDDGLYSAGAVQWLGRVRNQEDTVRRLLICGHNPGLDYLVETLSSSNPPLSPSGKLMTTAAIAHLRFETPWADIRPLSGTLVQIVRPR